MTRKKTIEESEIDVEETKEQEQKEPKVAENEIGEEIKLLKGKKELLVPLEEYVKAGIHLGTKIIMPDMKKYVYRRRADGLAILNTTMIDEELRKACEFINKYKGEEIMLICKREAGWDATKLFSKIIGTKIFNKKYPAGIITNHSLKDFFEPSLTIIVDSWLDKNVVRDSNKIGIPVVGLCDTNNITKGVSVVIPCNNKSNKSIGLIFYILARHYCKKQNIPFKYEINDFSGEK